MSRVLDVGPGRSNGMGAGRNRRIVRSLTFGYLAVVLVIVGVTVPTLVSTLSTLNQQESAYDIASNGTSQLLVAALNMETGIRGYVLTAQSSYLAPFSSGTTEFRTAASTLQGLKLGATFRRELTSTTAALDGWRTIAMSGNC